MNYQSTIFVYAIENISYQSEKKFIKRTQKESGEIQSQLQLGSTFLLLNRL